MTRILKPTDSLSRSGFTLVEVIVATSLSLIVMAGVLTAFFLFTRSGISMTHYHDMETETRQLMQRFGVDARQASKATWRGPHEVELTLSGLLANNDSRVVRYEYDPGAETFSRSIDGLTQVMASGLLSFEFEAYDHNQSPLPLNGSNGETKMIQIRFGLKRGTTGSPSATQSIVSARYILRNKPTNF